MLLRFSAYLLRVVPCLALQRVYTTPSLAGPASDFPSSGRRGETMCHHCITGRNCQRHSPLGEEGRNQGLFILGNKPEALAMHIQDLHTRIAREVLAQLGDVHVHATAVEVVVITPHLLQRFGPGQQPVGMHA